MPCGGRFLVLTARVALSQRDGVAPGMLAGCDQLQFVDLISVSSEQVVDVKALGDRSLVHLPDRAMQPLPLALEVATAEIVSLPLELLNGRADDGHGGVHRVTQCIVPCARDRAVSHRGANRGACATSRRSA